MNLFQCTNAVSQTVSAPTVVRTPLGTVRFGIRIGDNEIGIVPPAQTYRLPDNGWFAVWHHEHCDLELLVCRPFLALPADMQVTDCWAALWRIQAREADVGPLLFTAVWEDNHNWHEGGPNSGEHLHAWTWEDKFIGVTIGTQDEEMLASRVRHGDHLPTEWSRSFADFWRHPAHAEWEGRGLACPLPLLPQGQGCQIQFAVAWAPREEIAPWFAVDLQSADILAGTPCS